MKKFDIDVIFTEKVTEYIIKGYTINSSSMAGHQGEVNKVDLVKGEELVRIYLQDETSFFWEDYEGKWNGRMRVLRVGIWQFSASISDKSTVWMDKLDIIEERIFYQLDNYKTPWYVEDVEEALKAQSLRHERSKIRRQSEQIVSGVWDFPTHKEIASKYLKRKLGYQRVSQDYLAIRQRGNEYSVVYRDNSYRLK